MTYCQGDKVTTSGQVGAILNVRLDSLGEPIYTVALEDATVTPDGLMLARKCELAPVDVFKVEVIADSTAVWCSNGLEFDSLESAKAYAADLFFRWTAVRQTRVVQVSRCGEKTVVYGSE